jgi:hypothetical protein
MQLLFMVFILHFPGVFQRCTERFCYRVVAQLGVRLASIFKESKRQIQRGLVSVLRPTQLIAATYRSNLPYQTSNGINPIERICLD